MHAATSALFHHLLTLTVLPIFSCQESDESDSELVLLQEEMERREAELEEEVAEEADLTVGYNSPTNTPLSLTFRYCSVHA